MEQGPAGHGTRCQVVGAWLCMRQELQIDEYGFTARMCGSSAVSAWMHCQ